ncbi:MAG: DUF5690 family protein, partial [Leptospiraceae bacterium]|nr:DUF5690 family protein [Leptospiraceae bacterium]
AVIVPLGILYRIQSNRMAFFTCIAIITTSIVLIAASSLLLKWRLVDGAAWMILSGMAVYAGYIPYNIMLFERLMAVFQIRANAGFFVYIADSVGYLGSVVVLLLKNFAAHTLPWQSFIMEFAVFLVLVCLPLLFFSVHYLLRRLPTETG